MELTVASIDGYDSSTGILTLKHDYQSSTHAAEVSIEHVREGLPTTATAIGSWVNVVGYIEQHHGKNSASGTAVQATLLWGAGPMKMSDYERALQARKDTTS
jgi:hypothetical protein